MFLVFGIFLDISLDGKRNMKGAALYVIDDHEKYRSSKTSIYDHLLVKN
jgi:hypothetical protein